MPCPGVFFEVMLRRRIISVFARNLPCPLRTVLKTLAAVMILAVANSAAIPALGASNESDRIHWKQVPQAQVKLDDRTPLAWNVYQPDKKDKKKYSSLILVLLGRRYLMLDTKAKLVYEVTPSDLRAQGKEFESDDLALRSRLIPTSEWSNRDVGPAKLIRVTLGDYGRVLRVSLPHPPDLRPFY
jgi:hypothetical protein